MLTTPNKKFCTLFPFLRHSCSWQWALIASGPTDGKAALVCVSWGFVRQDSWEALGPLKDSLTGVRWLLILITSYFLFTGSKPAEMLLMNPGLGLEWGSGRPLSGAHSESRHWQLQWASPADQVLRMEMATLEMNLHRTQGSVLGPTPAFFEPEHSV